MTIYAQLVLHFTMIISVFFLTQRIGMSRKKGGLLALLSGLFPPVTGPFAIALIAKSIDK